MPRGGVLGWSIISLFGAALGVSVAFMAVRVRAYNRVQPPAQWHFEQYQARTFPFQGREVDVQDAKMEDGTPALRVRYGSLVRLIPVMRPLLESLGDLGGYEESVAVLAFAPVRLGKIEVNWRSGEGVRLVIVARSTAGYSAETWGGVRVKDWWFDLYELRADGTIVQSRGQFPDSRGRLPALLPGGAGASPGGVPITMLRERSWEWQAALFAVPRAQVSRYRFKTDAVGGTPDAAGMGWTLPAAGVSAMGVVLGVLLVGSASVARRTV